MKPAPDLCPWLPEALGSVQQLLIDSVQDMPGGYKRDIEALITAGGKRLRPKLVLVSGRLGMPDMQKLTRLAAGIELLHTATLIHDDVIDNAKTRRGIPSLQTLFSAREAVISGDYLLAKSLSLLHSVLGAGSTDDFLQGILHICRSELLQHASRFNPDAGLRSYNRRIAGKTAALFVLSCYCGGIEGKLDESGMQGLRRYGYSLGMAFQIIDDILDISGNPKDLQKPALQDMRQGIYTLPVLLAMGKDPSAKAMIGRYARRQKAVPAGKLKAVLTAANALDEAYGVANRYMACGMKALAQLPGSDEKEYLQRLIESLSKRIS